MESAGITETYVILSGARSAQSKDLSGDETVLRAERRRSFDSLRSLRMTNPYVLRLFVTSQTLIRIVNCQFTKSPFSTQTNSPRWQRGRRSFMGFCNGTNGVLWDQPGTAGCSLLGAGDLSLLTPTADGVLRIPPKKRGFLCSHITRQQPFGHPSSLLW